MSTETMILIGVAAAAVLLPRTSGIAAKLKSLLAGSKASKTTAPDANAIAAAYSLLGPYLDASTAAKVRSQVADRLLGGPLGPVVDTTSSAEQ